MTQAINSRILKTEDIPWKELQFLQQEGFKEWVTGGDAKLLQSIVKYQFVDPFKVWENNGVLYCLDGWHRWHDLKKAADSGIQVPDRLPATFIACTDIKEASQLVLVYSSVYAKITHDGLDAFLHKFDLDLPEIKESLSLPEFDLFEYEANKQSGSENESSEYVITSLQERFIVPPFSVLDTKQGYWQDRKRLWNSLGFDSQETREGIDIVSKGGQVPAVYDLRNEMRNTLGREPNWDEILQLAKQRNIHVYEGASIFDPVLAEVCYKWFCPPGGVIIDPFAGGSVRGIVAALLNFEYYGIDLRRQQVEANLKQAEKLCRNVSRMPIWLTGNSDHLLTGDYINKQADFIFSCPPYHDLEVYSDNPEDLSNMDYHDFCEAYRSIITKALNKLKPNRFACFVVGDMRDSKGFYRDFVSETIDCFTNCIDENGCVAHLYNEIILVTVAGSLPLRSGKLFSASRKVGKMHQNVLVFYKGDPSKIKEDFPALEVADIEQLVTSHL